MFHVIVCQDLASQKPNWNLFIILSNCVFQYLMNFTTQKTIQLVIKPLFPSHFSNLYMWSICSFNSYDGPFFRHIGTQAVLDEVAVCQLNRGLCEWSLRESQQTMRCLSKSQSVSASVLYKQGIRKTYMWFQTMHDAEQDKKLKCAAPAP